MKVTIGLPFYNNEQTLADAIRSVFAQSLQDWELILIDDGSQDRSLEIARSVDDSRVRVFSDSINKGLAARLNQVAELAQGEYIARMDADDMMHPRRLEEQLALLDQRPDIDVIGSAMYSIDASYAIQGTRGNQALNTTARSGSRDLGTCHRRCPSPMVCRAPIQCIASASARSRSLVSDLRGLQILRSQAALDVRSRTKDQASHQELSARL